MLKAGKCCKRKHFGLVAFESNAGILSLKRTAVRTGPVAELGTKHKPEGEEEEEEKEVIVEEEGETL